MSHPVAVAHKRAVAEARLRMQADRLARTVGVEFVPPSIPANRFPDLYAAELIERVADFLQAMADNVPPRPERKNR